MIDEFVNRIKEYIGSNKLLEDGAKVIVGLSGGADSTALLLVLLRLGYRVHAVHCNFHLRGSESDRDRRFAEDLCNRLGVEFTVCDYDTRKFASDNGISIEMAARHLRYADFERIMTECGASAICIAHHRDDSVETVLLNLIRGTGIKGLTGIKPRNGYIIRPLLCVSRQEIEEWLKQVGQTYVTDSTNLETDYTRNKIRLQLLPLMRSINPSADESVISTAGHLQQAYEIYNSAVISLREQILSESNGTFVIDIAKLRSVPSVQGVLFEILSPLGFNDSQITDIALSIDSQPGTRFLSATHQLIKERNSFCVSAINNTSFKPITANLEPGSEITLSDGSTLTVSAAPAGSTISTSPDVATFDASLLKEGRITVRLWQDGDWFIPFGMKGRKLVSDYLTDSKVSVKEREKQLVVTHGDEIIWVIGRRSDNRYRVSSRTGNQIILTFAH